MVEIDFIILFYLSRLYDIITVFEGTFSTLSIKIVAQKNFSENANFGYFDTLTSWQHWRVEEMGSVC